MSSKLDGRIWVIRRYKIRNHKRALAGGRPTAIVIKSISKEVVKTGGKDEFIKFVNAPLTIWFLSSVALAVASWGYSKWTADRDTEQRRASMIMMIDNEIAFRLDRGIMALRVVAYRHKMSYRAVPASVFGLPPTEYQLYPAFSRRGLASLMNEERTLMVPGSDEERCLNGAIMDSTALQNRWVSIPPKNENDADSMEHDLGRIMVRRWYNASRTIIWYRYLDETLGGLTRRSWCLERTKDNTGGIRIPPS